MIVVSDISKRYKKKKVLQHVSFKAESGQNIVIVGKNGCGKSTLLQIMAGVLKPDSGRVSYFGKDAVGKNSVFRKYCGYVPQENPLLEELSVRDNLRLWGAGKRADPASVMAKFHLDEIMKMPVEKLSGGMKRRLAIACALLEWPPVLLLDEPTSALDIYYREIIMDFLKEYQKMGGIVVMTSHDTQEILAADQCLVIADGKMFPLEDNGNRMDEIRRYIREPE
ncbi:MAG: heme ABC exporter ATP-binding protein CcmA [Clostridiales bacterium]|nr:heme ABC exporter ATP-binding protein CcmA [Clostridiales bacterium]